MLPDLQSKPPLAQLEPLCSCSIPCSLGEETRRLLAPASFQVAGESHRFPPEPSLLQTESPQVPQPFHITLVLQALHQLRCPSLELLQHLSVSLVMTAPVLNTGFNGWPHQCPVQGDNHCPGSSENTSADTGQDALKFRTWHFAFLNLIPLATAY